MLARAYAAWQRRIPVRSQKDFIIDILAELGEKPPSQEQIEALRFELLSNETMARTYEDHVARLLAISPHKRRTTWADRVAKSAAGVDIFYVLPRILKPSILVETGVAAGSMTSFILAALAENGTGTLYSFDLPPKQGEKGMDWSATSDNEVGFLIPQAYRNRWVLELDDATYALPPILKGKEVDYFFHDSDHTFEHMTYEYALARKHLKKSGLLVSDDVTWNDAFFRFCAGAGGATFVHEGNRNVGVAVFG